MCTTLRVLTAVLSVSKDRALLIKNNEIMYSSARNNSFYTNRLLDSGIIGNLARTAVSWRDRHDAPQPLPHGLH